MEGFQYIITYYAPLYSIKFAGQRGRKMTFPLNPKHILGILSQI